MAGSKIEEIEAGVKTVKDFDDYDESPIEQVRLTVPTDDDPSLPVWTFRMWFLGIISCALLSFLNVFFSYREQPLTISTVTITVAALPIGRLMAKLLPTTQFGMPGFGSRRFSLNPGPFNMKEHVLISIFASVGGSPAYALGIVDLIKAFYMRKIHFLAGWILIITTQVLGYGWAGIFRKYVVQPAEMWWPGTLVQVSLFRALHEKEHDSGRTSRSKFFFIALLCSFLYAIVPGFLFTALGTISVLCLLYPKSVRAQQIGSGLDGLGIGSFSFDWATIAGFNGSPLVTPFFSIVNVMVGYVIVAYALIPSAYWGLNVYSARTYPIFSANLFTPQGQYYNVSGIINDKFEINMSAYERYGQVHISTFFALAYGFSFAGVAAILVHVALFNGKEIIERYRDSHKGKQDIHTRMMNKYKDVPSWWFHSILGISLILSVVLCVFMKKDVQLPWWGLIFAAGIALIFTLPISIITAVTNQTPGLNVITELIMGYIYPGKPIANVCFKTYGYISMIQAVSFLGDFKLGHYMKIPPRSMFAVQLIGTVIAGTINMSTGWYLLTTIPNICHPKLLPENSPWTCRSDNTFYSASVIWGLIGPKRMFGSLGNYTALNWFFVGGAIAPLIVWMLHKAFPKQTWIRLINIPVILGATAIMPPASTINFNCFIVVGIIFNFFIYRYRKSWWSRYNYVLSAALDGGVAFMAVLIYFGLTMHNVEFYSWWGTKGDGYCPLATCPTAKGIVVENCPVF